MQVFGTTTTTTDITTSHAMKTPTTASPPRNESSCCTSPRQIKDESADFDTGDEAFTEDDKDYTLENGNKERNYFTSCLVVFIVVWITLFVLWGF